MDGEKLSELIDEALSVNSTDRLYIVQSGQSKFLSGQTLNAIASGVQIISWNPQLNQLTISGGNTIQLAPPSVTVSGSEQTFSLDDGYLLEKVAIIPTGNQTVTLGTTTGGSDLFSETVDDGVAMVVGFDHYANGSQTIYINATNCVVKFYLR